MNDREQKVISLYKDLRAANSHKMVPIPVFKLKRARGGN